MLISTLIGVVLAFGQLWTAVAPAQVRNTIEGRVLTTEGRPLVNARVVLQNDSYSEVNQVYADGSGRFVFKNLPSGTYNVVADSIDGAYERQSQRVEADAINTRLGRGGEFFRIEFALKLKKGATPDTNTPAAPAASVFVQDVPEAAKKEFALGVKSIEKDNFEGAVASMKQALELFPDYYEALDRLGSEYVKRRNYDQAMPLLEHAIEVNKDGWTSYYYLGVAQIESKKLPDGIQSLRRALDLNPNSVNANMRLGMALSKNEKTYDEAIQSFKKVMQLAGKQVPDVHFFLAQIYANQKHYKEAADSLEEYLKFIPASDTQQRDQYKKLIEQLRQHK